MIEIIDLEESITRPLAKNFLTDLWHINHGMPIGRFAKPEELAVISLYQQSALSLVSKIAICVD